MTDHFEKHYKRANEKSALDVLQGVDNQPIVNPYFSRFRRKKLTVEQFVEGILARNVAILSQAITLVESNNPSHYRDAQQIIERCLPYAGRSVRIGITGVPGAGKSTFIEAIGGMVVGQSSDNNVVTSTSKDVGHDAATLIEGAASNAVSGVSGVSGVAAAVQNPENHRLAVLAIDPSSERSGGSILGDKTRMESISTDPRIYIRPSPSAGSLGGVARKTRETVVLCEAAGYDVIFIETVGVGQSETAVHSMVDVFVLLQIAGAGDELQGIKRGIMEMVDAIVITKAEGDNITRAELAKRQFENALMLFPTPESGWRPKVYTSSAYSGAGLEEVWNGVGEFLSFVRENGYFDSNRNLQNQYWMRETIEETLRSNFYNNPLIERLLPEYRRMVMESRKSSFAAAGELLDKYYGEK